MYAPMAKGLSWPFELSMSSTGVARNLFELCDHEQRVEVLVHRDQPTLQGGRVNPQLNFPKLQSLVVPC